MCVCCCVCVPPHAAHPAPRASRAAGPPQPQRAFACGALASEGGLGELSG